MNARTEQKTYGPAGRNDIDPTMAHRLIRRLREAGYKPKARGIYYKGDKLIVIHLGGSWSSYDDGERMGYGTDDLDEMFAEAGEE